MSFQIPPAISHTLEKRDYVINELVETEKNYVDVLTTLQCDFMRPLNNVLRKEDSKVIFAHIKVAGRMSFLSFYFFFSYSIIT